MYQQQQYHTGQGPFHPNIYPVRGPNGQPVYIDGYTLKPLPYNELIARGLLQPGVPSQQIRPAVPSQQISGPSPLPEGWEERKNEGGITYYVNHKTQATQWQRPTEQIVSQPAVLSQESSGPLPEGWDERKNKDDITYYINHKTQATQWQRPTEQIISKPAVPTRESSVPLPEGWEEKKNKDGIPYYVNHNTKATQWQRPTGKDIRKDPKTSQAVNRQPSPSRGEINQVARRKSSENTHQQDPSQQSQSGQYLAPHANQRQRKSFSEAGDSQNAPNTSQGVRRKSSSSRGENNQEVRRKSSENTHQSGQYLASHANQRQRKSFSEAGDSQNVPSTSLAVRRKSSTLSKGETSHGARRKSRDSTHRKSVSETRESQNIRSNSTNVTPGEHRSRRDKSESSTSLSRQEQRNHSKSPNEQLNRSKSPNEQRDRSKSPNVPLLGFGGWDVKESNAQKSSRETGSNEKQTQKTNTVESTEGRATEVKSEYIPSSSVPNIGPEITVTNEYISQSQTTSKEIDPWQIKNIPSNQKHEEQQIDNDHQFSDFVNNRISHIVITGPKESQENIKIVSKGPSNLNKGPGYISNGPASLNKGPIECTKGPSEITKGPGDLNKGPGNLSKGPCDLNQGPLEHIHEHDFTSKLAKGPSSALCCGPSIFVRGPSLSRGSCKATIGPILSKGPTILSKGSIKQATVTV